MSKHRAQTERGQIKAAPKYLQITKQSSKPVKTIAPRSAGRWEILQSKVSFKGPRGGHVQGEMGKCTQWLMEWASVRTCWVECLDCDTITVMSPAGHNFNVKINYKEKNKNWLTFGWSYECMKAGGLHFTNHPIHPDVAYYHFQDYISILQMGGDLF